MPRSAKTCQRQAAQAEHRSGRCAPWTCVADRYLCVSGWCLTCRRSGGLTYEAPGAGIAAELERQVIEAIVAREVRARACVCVCVGGGGGRGRGVPTGVLSLRGERHAAPPQAIVTNLRNALVTPATRVDAGTRGDIMAALADLRDVTMRVVEARAARPRLSSLKNGFE